MLIGNIYICFFVKNVNYQGENCYSYEDSYHFKLIGNYYVIYLLLFSLLNFKNKKFKQFF